MLGNVSSVLLDIEGTTSSISFVKDLLFPYARNHVAEYLQEHWNDEECQTYVQSIRETVDVEIKHAIDLADLGERTVCNLRPVPQAIDESTVEAEQQKLYKESIMEAVLHNVRVWMDEDRKITCLKELQGAIWRGGYRSGMIKGHLFPDVVIAMQKIKSFGMKLYIYSSGSVAAQKLLFKNSVSGDVTPLISGYFDTTTGLKDESTSYTKIAEAISESPSKIIFLTDMEAEAEAAHKASMNVALAVRPGNHPLSRTTLDKYTTISSFDELFASDSN
jgi:enolase-phosphatase E1